MCSPASFIVTKDSILWLPGSNSHEDILEANNLDDSSKSPDFTRVEISPPNMDFSKPFSEWKYNTDQDWLPDWYVASFDEERVRKELPNWYAVHIIGQNTDINEVMQKGGNDSTQTAGHFSTQTAGIRSTQTTGNYSTQTAGIRSMQTAGFRSMQTAGDCSTQTAGNCSMQTAGDGSTQTAGIGTVQIIRWYDNGDKVKTRTITKRTADKPYKFYDGNWHLVENS